MGINPPEPKPQRSGRRYRQRPTRATLVVRAVLILAVLACIVIILIGVLNSAGSRSGANVPYTPTAGLSVGVKTGDSAPNFTLPTPQGKRLSLSDYRGHPVVLNFWYADCPGCLTEIPGMVKFYNSQDEFDSNLVVLGINVLDDATTAKAFAKRMHMTYPIVLDSQQRVETLYTVNATPTTFFIDRQGVIRNVVIGPVPEEQLQREQRLLV